jgi:hypothetical protein
MAKEATMKKVLSLFQLVVQDHNCTRYQGFPCVILLTESQGWVVTFPWELLRFSKSLTWRPTNKVGTLNITQTNMVQTSKKNTQYRLGICVSFVHSILHFMVKGLHFPTLPCPGVSKPLPTMAFVSWLHLTV